MPRGRWRLQVHAMQMQPSELARTHRSTRLSRVRGTDSEDSLSRFSFSRVKCTGTDAWRDSSSSLLDLARSRLTTQAGTPPHCWITTPRPPLRELARVVRVPSRACIARRDPHASDQRAPPPVPHDRLTRSISAASLRSPASWSNNTSTPLPVRRTSDASASRSEG